MHLESENDESARRFEAHRSRLFGVAYRMLGSRVDAEDVLQDAYLRWHRADTTTVETPEAWLVTVVTRLCLDRLRASKQERALYVGPWLPEPIVSRTMDSAETQLEFANEVSVAFLAVLERLGAQERAAFLLHDVFDYDYADIARMLDKTEAACRQIVHRARERVRSGRPRYSVPEQNRQLLLERFLQAATSGDREAVAALLSEDVSFISDGGGKVTAALKILNGPERIGRLYYCIARRNPKMSFRLIRVNGELGAVHLVDGKLHSVLSFETSGERILGIYVMRNPDKLAGINVSELGI